MSFLRIRSKFSSTCLPKINYYRKNLMKIKVKCLICFLLIATLTVLPACSMFWSSNHSYSGGQILDEEMMSSIREEIISAEETTDGEEESEETTKKENTAHNGLVYWTEGGGVYHFYKDCGYIKSASKIMSGSITDARNADKTGVCSRCQSRKDKE